MPSFTYNPENLTLTNNTASSDLPLAPTFHYSGDVPTNWVLIGTLPVGLNFGTNNGTIWGTPTELWTTTNYTVYGNNTGGSFNVSINITVNDQMPTLSYSPANLTLYNNTASSDLPLNATLTGPGEITSWAIAPDLPNGLSFGTSNGTIWGIPTVLQTTAVTYTVWANNSGGSTVAYLNITVVDELPTISYTPNILNVVNNTESTDLPLAPIITGSGEITSWGINATLPDGIQFGTGNGTIWGTPTELWPQFSYLIWANNSGGSTSTLVTISVVDQVPSLNYSPNKFELVNNTLNMSFPLLPILSGPGEITSWAINTTLPDGIQFGTDNGTFWGIATKLWQETNYTVWANNSGGSTSTTITFVVIDQLPLLTYALDSIQLTNDSGHDDMPLVPELTGFGEITSWSISGELPAGLNFGYSNGTIWGISTELWPETVYIIWANNSGGSSSTTLSITVFDQIPAFSYLEVNITLQNNVSTLDLNPISIGGQIASWSISPQISPGLFFDLDNGSLYGVPTQVKNQTMYVISATNDIGTTMFYLNITVRELFYDTSLGGKYLIRAINMMPYGPQLGPDDAEYGIHPMLPQGLFIGSDNGTIWGTPMEVFVLTKYTIYANSSSFDDTFVIYIEVLEDTDLDGMPDEVPSIVNPLQGLIEDLDDDNDQWTDEEELMCGPTDSKDASSIPVDTDEDGICDFIEELVISYPNDVFEFIQGQTNISLIPVISGMSVDRWEISPVLPEGMLFGNDSSSANGTIFGIPYFISQNGTYTVTAFNSLTNSQVITTINFSVVGDFDLDGKSDNDTILGLFEVDADDDNDGFEDTVELDCKSNPYDRFSFPKLDDSGNCLTSETLEETQKNDPNQSQFGSIFFITLLLSSIAIVSFILRQKKEKIGVRPEHVTARPAFEEGDGTVFSPYKLEDTVVPYDTSAESIEVIRCAGITPNADVKFIDKQEDVNGGRFAAIISGGPQAGESKLKSNEYGVMSIKLIFDASINPESEGAEYHAEIILDDDTHLIWKVETEKQQDSEEDSNEEVEEESEESSEKKPEEDSESEDEESPDTEKESETKSTNKSKQTKKKSSNKKK
ncbi:MAG: hypothetical protein CMA25_02535 [Euryarchaeota archaeon]|nr:hypothetical protein [Euryarchaeota archaeon]